MTPQMIAHEARTTCREKMPQPITRSAFETNLSAAPSSIMPITILTDFSHPPERGSFDSTVGARARKKNGTAKVVEKRSSPTTGCCHCPCDASTRSVPTKGAVQVKVVTAKVAPMRTEPTAPVEARSRLAPSRRLRIPDGIRIS